MRLCRKYFLFFFFHLRQSVAQKPLLLASAASRSPVTLGRPTVTRLGENNNLPKNPRKKNLENVATATDFFFLRLSLSLPLAQQQQQQENNIAFEMSSYIVTFVLILSVMCLVVYTCKEADFDLFSFFWLPSYYYLRQQCI